MSPAAARTRPDEHAVQQTFVLYVYQPGGNRIELRNPLPRLILRTTESFHTHATGVLTGHGSGSIGNAPVAQPAEAGPLKGS